MSLSKSILFLFLFLFLLSCSLTGQILNFEYRELGPEFNFFSLDEERIEVVDFNLNGFNDVFYPDTESMNFLENLGSLQFDYFELMGIGFNSMYEVIDIDGDGFKDIVYWDFNDYVLVKNNQGILDFSNETAFIEPEQSGSIFYFIDIDNDSDPDLVYLSDFSSIIKVVFNDNGVFGNERILLDYGVSNISNYWIYDIDLDNDLDFIVLNENIDLDILINNGSGGFEAKSLTSSLNFVSPTVFVQDINGDEFLDFLILDSSTSGNSPAFTWIEQLANCEFGETKVIDYHIEHPHIDFGDLDQDGDLDIVASSLNAAAFVESEIIWMKNDGIGNFDIEVLFAEDIDFTETEISDIDNDGDLDIVTILKEQDGSAQLIMIENQIETTSIRGVVFFDENSNGIRDAIERGLESFHVILEPDMIRYQLNKSDGYIIFVEDGTYTLSPEVPSIWKLTTDSASYTVNIDGNSQSNLDFGFIPTQQLFSGQMHAVSGITRCNRETKFDFIFQNTGTTIITEGVVFAFLDDLVSIGTEIDPIDTIGVTGELGWKFENLYPGQTVKKSILLNIPGIGGDVEPGTLIKIFSATEAKDTQGFVNFFKNNFESEILCAYDPNDKLINPDREGDENYTQFKDTMIYTVRFQNTGNDTAFTVVIRDTLDQNLDVSTFNILGSSHREVLKTEILDDQFISFSFEDILLPDSTVDFVGSQGYVSYSIEPKDGIAENTIIENTASIYFDFNPPIVTNTTQNTMVECLPITPIDVSVIIGAGETYTLPDGAVVDESGVYTTQVLDEDNCPTETTLTTVEVLTSNKDLSWNQYVNLSPNPTEEYFNLDIETNTAIDHELVIFNILGEEVLRQKVNLKSSCMGVQQLTSGTYMLQLTNVDKEVVAVKKLVVL